jgi:hypothetical protein
MPTVRLSTVPRGRPFTVVPRPGRLLIPRVQLRCLIRVPNVLLPRDGVIDTGAPLTHFPQAIWTAFREGIDFEWLPFPSGGQPPTGQVVNWRFTYRMARFLVPLTLMDYTTQIDRPSVVAQFADTDPPSPAGQRALPAIIFGLWGGALEGGRIAIDRDPVTGSVTGSVEFP